MSDMMQFVDPKSLVVDEEALNKAVKEHTTTFTYEVPGPWEIKLPLGNTIVISEGQKVTISVVSSEGYWDVPAGAVVPVGQTVLGPVYINKSGEKC